MEGGDTVFPFVRQFYGTPSTYLWQDDEGAVHDVQQGEGGEQGDASMPVLFALGQHNALVTLQLRLTPQERLFAFLDDIYVVCSPDRVLPIFQALEVELWVHSRIQIHQGRPNSGTKAGFLHRGGRHWRHTRGGLTQMLSFGEVTGVFPRTSRA